VASGLDLQIDLVENQMTAGAHTGVFKLERGGRCDRARRPFSASPCLPFSPSLFLRAQRFESPKRDVALRRILLCDQRDLLSERRQIERPVDQQQRAAGFAASRQMIEQQPRRRDDRVRSRSNG
jgi:hypothetical protein